MRTGKTLTYMLTAAYAALSFIGCEGRTEKPIYFRARVAGKSRFQKFYKDCFWN